MKKNEMARSWGQVEEDARTLRAMTKREEIKNAPLIDIGAMLLEDAITGLDEDGCYIIDISAYRTNKNNLTN